MIAFPLVGNEKIANAVLGSFKENRLPHAIIIEGDEGTGRHTLATYLCKGAVCEGAEKPCGSCINCNLIKSNNHPDVSVIKPAENKKFITVDQVREIIEQAVIKPNTAKGKVFIIDPADNMNPQAQNALLKILEEPPENTYFILIAENKSALLETVISRSVVLSLTSVELSAGVEYLSKNSKYTTEVITFALKEAGLNIGKAIKLLSGKKKSKANICAKEFLRFMDLNDSWGMLSTTAAFEKNRLLAEEFLKELKLLIVSELKLKNEGNRAKKLFRLYSEIAAFEKNLELNINLNLLYCSLVSSVMQMR
ncbi:MAG: DNA polymerase III subunit delta' [Clostridia bacterium]|nr:DNA polymerase III subunit delta' [Clostridia bacterium]